MPYTYKVKVDEQGKPTLPDGTVIPLAGVVQNGHIKSDLKIENPKLELVDGDTPSAHIAGVVPQAEQTAQPTTESEGQL